MDLVAWSAGLETLEADATLEKDTALQARARALDFLAQLDEYASSRGGDEAVRRLQARAEALSLRLTWLNTQLFQNLRQQIRAGYFTPQALRRLFDQYTYYTSAPKGVAHVGPDGLDLLVNGVLEIGAAPAATRERLPDMIHYEPAPARLILDLIDNAGLQPGDVFSDLGSGLGQAVILVNLLTGIRAKGVEFEPAFCDAARACARRLGLANVEFINADAREVDYAGGTVFYLFTPFKGEILRAVLAKLRGEARTRQLRLCTHGPCTRHMAQEPWVKSLDANADSPFRLALFESV
jgi:hypothetical protein